MRTKMSHSVLVKEFTEESKGIKVPSAPVPMSADSVRFLAKMMLSEISEMLESHHNRETSKLLMHMLINEDFDEKSALHANTPEPQYPKAPEVQIEEQMDAIVDCWYYGLDGAAKHGMNLEPVFQAVHAANMNKRDPTTGQFMRRPDGKVIKPDNWQPADISQIVANQLNNGAW